MSTMPTMDGDDPNRRFAEMFKTFLEKGAMAGTYKAVFLRALTDIGRYGADSNLVGSEWIELDGDKIKMKLDFVASRLTKYYWDMEIAFKMRHTPKRMADADNPDADIRIIKIIRDEQTKVMKERAINAIKEMSFDDMQSNKRIRHVIDSLHRDAPPTLEHLSSEKMAEFRNHVIKFAMQEVLDHLPNDMPNLYTKVRGQNYILLDPDIIGFMKTYAPIIRKALNYILAIHLEKNNPEARHIATKINEEVAFDRRMDAIRQLEIKIAQVSPQKEPRAVPDVKPIKQRTS